ncbi:DivIVA domain-containing protein [Pseudarthrobacter defluvii]|uniref:DivIVA domain-containing protein n=1 Tax=Pseudarthrobacter defluvii TaxID=410837 RepID=UPI002781B48E|nr:DivIVA domain-containing protein [Pseudarthrobacter defluvii]MDQ0768466.1 DivIVA domain-containing protein [Pseudarthrobacter defluvii]
MSFFLVFLAVVLAAAVLWAGLGRRSRKAGKAGLPALLDGGFEEPPANLPPVLLPEQAVPEDVTRLRFSLGLRGYRMDQVDQVLDELRDQLAAKDAEIAELRGRLETSPELPAEQASGDGSAAGNEAGERSGAAGAGDSGETALPAGSAPVPEDAAPGKGGL